MTGGRGGARIAIAAAIILTIAALWWFRRDLVAPPPLAAEKPAPAKSPAPGAATPASSPTVPGEPAVEGESRLADQLNAPENTIQRDLQILHEVFEAWLTDFPRDGNPVGENAEITAALTGKNVHRFAFIPRRHRAINAAGELCDRWGSPFRFHQLSGRQMEIRSAGPDRKFGSADDAVWTPQ